MEKPIYLDYNATTPVDPAVLDVMLPFFKGEFGNPSSNSHAYGWDADSAIRNARDQVSKLINSKKSEIIWTSGATESNNLAIEGIIRPLLQAGKTPHIITSNIEHKAVIDVCKCLESRGAELSVLPVNEFGLIAPQQVENAIKDNTALITIMLANNEIGTINPTPEIAKIANKHKIPFHTDAAQGVGKTPIDATEWGLDLLSGSGHKMYGPKGIGFLYVKKGIELQPLFCGGSQEKGIRPGTLNVPGIVALGKACEIAAQNMDNEIKSLTALRNQFIDKILNHVPEAVLNGCPQKRLYSNASFSFKNLSSDIFTLGLSGLAVSSSSACSSTCPEPSYVLKALGHCDNLARATVRFGIGRFTTDKELQIAAEKVIKMAEKNRSLTI